MAGPNTRGGKRGKKKIYLKPSETGGQFYQSDRARKSMLETPGDDALGAVIDRELTKEMHAGKITPERAGKTKARTYVDRVYDAHSSKMNKGGAVRGYEGGGEVCRGNGRAFQGKAKRVQVR